MLDVDAVRESFPALSREVRGAPAVYLDGPGGTQAAAPVIDAMAGHLRDGTSNLGGSFVTSEEAGEVTAAARRAGADLFNAEPEEIVFGQNMTSLTFSVSRALADTWRPGDEIVVTNLDHDANVTPWVLAATGRGVVVRQVDFVPEDGCALDYDGLAAAVGPSTRLVAVTCASNAVGTIVDVRRVVEIAHGAGALVYADAVHYAPHALVDVSATGVDFLAASSYKFFGPHTGLLYGRVDQLDRLDAYKVRPAPSSGPGKWETGTQSFESLAGVAAAVDYLAGLGAGGSRRERLAAAFGAVGEHERALSARFLAGLAEIPGVRLHGHAVAGAARTPTFAVAVEGVRPADVERRLGEQGIFVWSGHYYAVAVMERLGVLDEGGLVRIGFVHYNTVAEVDRVLDALTRLSG